MAPPKKSKKSLKKTRTGAKSRTSKKRTPVKSRRKSTVKGGFGNVFALMFKWGVVAAIWGGLILAVIIGWHAYHLPNIADVKGFDRSPLITVQDVHGQTIGRSGNLSGDVISVDELPPYVPAAFVAIEDRRFYDHIGVDVLGVARAMVTNIVELKFSQGGSTITQQLAKNLYLTPDKTLSRKIRELLLAFWLEHELTKDEILTAYLNRVYFGAGAYGIDAASRRYFDKPADQLNLPQAAMLAGLLKAPSRYSPLSNPELADERMRVVLSAMEDAGYILSGASVRQAQLTTVSRPASQDPNRYFTDWVIDQAGGFIGGADRNIVIKTTFNADLQERANKNLQTVLNDVGEARQIGQAGLVILDMDGAVKAMIGGRNYKTSQFNRVTQARRQTGSVFKPFVYLAALEAGYGSGDKILDAPLTIGDYHPENFKDEYAGEVTLTQALAKSMNTATVRLAQDVGLSAVSDVARRAGLSGVQMDDLSVALGSAEQSLIDVVASYATLSNGGYATYPYAIVEITDEDGQILYQYDHDRGSRQFSYGDLYHLKKMLERAVEDGTGKRAYINGLTRGGKTGTTQNFRDAWFVGYSDDLVMGVWMGNDDNTPMVGVTGGSYPADLWRLVMLEAEDDLKKEGRGQNPISSFTDMLKGLLSP